MTHTEQNESDGSSSRDVTPVYMSAAVNQFQRAMVYSEDTGLLVYGANGRLLCYSPKTSGVVCVSKEIGSGNVSCLRCVYDISMHRSLFFATYTSGDIALWELVKDAVNTGSVTDMLHRRIYIKGNSKVGGIGCGDCLMVSSHQSANITDRYDDGEVVMMVTVASDQNITVTTAHIATGAVLSTQHMSLRYRSLVLDLRLLQQDTDVCGSYSLPYILYGGDDSKLHILSASVCGDATSKTDTKITDETAGTPETKTTEETVDTAETKVTSDGNKQNTPIYEEVAVLPGHQDWVMAIDYIRLECGDVMLASGSKDGTIRVWRLQQSKSVSSSEKVNVSLPNTELKVKPVILRGGNTQALLETVLCGHDGWLSHLCWLKYKERVPSERNLRLVSCARTEDRAIILWQPQHFIDINESKQQQNGQTDADDEGDNEDEDVWVEAARLGEVGGNREGFYSAMFSADGSAVYAHSYQGGLHHWQYQTEGQLAGMWQPQPASTGHFSAVVDLSWEAEGGRYLLTTSLDQTTRLHAAVHNHRTKQTQWHEVCRPQVHGYDMSCVASVGVAGFVAGAEEKLLRSFSAPTNLLKSLGELCHWGTMPEIVGRDFVEEAAVPSLGLSNKSVQQQEGEQMMQQNTDRLTEDSLMASSLWPEVCKMYGHGYELVCVAASPHHIATACRAAASHDAAIIIWEVGSWQQLQTLPYHRLTVTQLTFTKDGHRLLSVSRSRTWAVYQQCSKQEGPFALLCHSGTLETKALHTRVIWAADWMSHGRSFVTASRDKTIAVWGPKGEERDNTVSEGDSPGELQQQSWVRQFTLQEPGEVTAVAVTSSSHNWIIATGLSSGSVRLHTYSSESQSISNTQELQPSHHSTVRRLAFRPMGQDNNLLLASCGDDTIVCIYDCFQYKR